MTEPQGAPPSEPSAGALLELDVFASFPARLVLFEDEHLVAIDKPWGLATHAPSEDRRDDVVSWLSHAYEKRGATKYLAVHQRLDRETSGVLVFGRSQASNGSLARQFSAGARGEPAGRAVEKTYVAVVEGRVPNRGELAHYLAPDRDGAMRARPRSGAPRRDEVLAITRFTTLARAEGRALVELKPQTGRTHQLRVQLAALGAPIVGDTLYGGPPAVRLMLHARSLQLTHPVTNKPLALDATTPRSFERFGKDAELDVDVLVREAAERRVGAALVGGTDALRIVNAEGDAVHGATIDLYGRHAVLSLYEDLEAPQVDALARAALSLGLDGVYLKRRPKHASRVVDTRREEVAPKEPIAGTAAPESFVIHENGVPFEVRLGDGLSTGIFLDQRENRRRLAGMTGGRSLLNLFAYTGAFSVVAAAHGATATTTVDVSATVLAWAERNLARVVGSPIGEHHELVESDVFRYLERAAKNPRRWDLVVLDPPSFSTTKKTTFSAESDYKKLAERALRLVAPGGSLLACTNHRGITMNRFRRHLHDATRLAGVNAVAMKSWPAPLDFPPIPGQEPHLKTVLVTLG
ncbi:MAG: class I SAM-dependent methyltransferase [Polyangiaceae bacterium]